MSIKIAYIGMSHLGLISGICMAEKGFDVVCFDNDKQLIDKLKSGDLIFLEPQLYELYEKNKKRIYFTFQLEDLKPCDIVYISKDVPTNEEHVSDLKPILSLIDLVSNSLEKESILVILSQVPPGFTKKVTFDKARLFYQVETLIFGRAIERALFPERIIIGCDKKSLPQKFLDFLSVFNCPVILMKYESAELSKIAINMFLVSSVTTTNTIAEICEKIKASWEDISTVLKLDKRIGQYAYLKPGLGIGGGNLQRDLITFTSLAKKYNTEHSILEAWQKNSSYRANWALEKFKENFSEKNKKIKIGLLGLAYKEDTASTKNSCALKLIFQLKDHFLHVFDPAVKYLPKSLSFAKIERSIGDVCMKADVLIIMTPWKDFKSIKPEILAFFLKYKLVIDPYGVLNMHQCEKNNLKYFRLGV
jgi:UDPglucose 6-dehydrogenase